MGLTMSVASPNVIATVQDVTEPEVRGTAQLKGDFVLVGTTVRFKTKSLCARCLSAIEGEHREKFDLTFEIDKTTEYIDLTDDIRQE